MTDRQKLIDELTAVPKHERLRYLAALPEARLRAFKQIMPPADIKKLNDHIDRALKKAAEPSYEKWIAEARAGRASTPDAMIEALREIEGKLKPQDALWVSRITDTASAGGFSRKQTAVITGIYARYFAPDRGASP